MRFLISLSTFLLLGLTCVPAMANCTYGDPDSCEQGSTCVYIQQGKTQCLKVDKSLPFIHFPFHPKRYLLCDQGVMSPDGESHTYENTIYALDLHTPKDSDPGTIFAGSAGVVQVYTGCQAPNTSCGAGFGNSIRLFRKDGVVIMYAHLDKIFVRSGDQVTNGQVIGVEGNTGMTGVDNRHLHISVHRDWRVLGIDYYKKFTAALPVSVPFRMNICQDHHQTCERNSLDIRELICKRVSGKEEPIRRSP